MKKAALFATVLALALSASAQQSQSVGPHVITPNARGGVSANAVDATSQAPNAQSASASAQQVPPIAAVAPNAIQQVGPTASEHGGLCLPIIVLGPTIGPVCK